MANIYLKGNGSGMTESEMKAATSHANRSISPSLLKEAVEYHNVQSNWGQSESSAPDYIKNKPAVAKYWASSVGYEVTGWYDHTEDGVTGVMLTYYDPDDNEEKYRFFADGPAFKSVAQQITNQIPSSDDIINLAYPVGSYYETSDNDFDPNATWTGTWEYSGGKWHRTA